MTIRSTEADLYHQLAEGPISMAEYASDEAGTSFLSAAHLDHSLIAQISMRNASAFALLYDRHAARLYTLALYSTGDTSAAEQIVVEVFQLIWQEADRLTTSANVAAWLIEITRQRAIDALKGVEQRRAALVGRFEQPMACLPASPLGQHEALKIRQALAELPSEQRTSIELAYYDGLLQSEIAAQLELPLSVVQRHLRQGLLSLHTKLFGE
jgi:RNA polymerase sigma-70 factor (ECF subfamily)